MAYGRQWNGKLGLVRPPVWGRAGEGGSAFGNRGANIAPPPPPTPPHKGEGSAPTSRRRSRPYAIALARGRENAPVAGRGDVMKFTLAWLKEHLETDAPLATIVDKLTMIGLEVESVADR